MLPKTLSQNPFILRFAVADAECQFLYEKEGRPALTACLNGGTLTITAQYEEHEEPLTLCCPAAAGDCIRFVYRPHRIELWKNKHLQDEEWPFGTALLWKSVLTRCAVELTAEDAPPENIEPQPAVTGTFTDPAEWLPGEGIYIGDCMPYVFEDRYHVLYLKDRRHHKSKWRKGAHQWEHISTKDLVHWDIHPMAVSIDDPMEGSICTGSWIYHNGMHYLYYTIRMSDGSAAPICRSVSEDGYHFHKDRNFRFTLTERYHRPTARDPKVIMGEDGMLHMFLTTVYMAGVTDGQKSSGKGCLAHLTSVDGEVWEEHEPFYLSDGKGVYVSEYADIYEPGCPDYIACGGRYYLIFSTDAPRYRVSDKPFSDFQAPHNDIIPCYGVPKAAVWHDRIIFTGFKRIENYAGHMVFTEAIINENGEFSFYPVPEIEK